MSNAALAERIATLRKRAGLKQDELAEKIGLNTSAVSRIESGSRGVSAYEVLAISEALQVDVNDLLVSREPKDVFAVALRSGPDEDVAASVAWFKQAVDDYLALQRLSK
jgi:transcriptional regulator with XRE-family HTH domain